jgi:hypothetical protein
MKKRLLIAAIAATMSVAATADISITGGAFVSFASQKVGQVDNWSTDNNNGANVNKDDQHVHIKVVGSAGDTKVVATIDSGSATHVDQVSQLHPVRGAQASDDDVSNVDTDSLHMDSLYITTKAGPVNIKAGDYWGTIGLGAHSKEANKKNAISVSTEVGGWKLGLFTANGSSANGGSSTNVSASGKAGPVTLGLVHNPDDFTDITVQGTLGGISIAAEKWDDTTDHDNDTTLIHIGGKVSNFKWDIAQLKNDKASVVATDWNNTLGRNVTTITRDAHSTGKLAPLGSMLIGTEARDRTATAVADVHDFTEILGVAVSTQLAGNTVKVIYTKNTLGAGDKVTGTELIISRPLGGATLTANIGKVSGVDELTKTNWGGIEGNATNMGLRLDVKF